MGVTNTNAFDEDRKNPIRKGHGPVQGQTQHTRTYKDRGLADNAQIDQNQFYTNNFDKQPRAPDVNKDINTTTHDKTYTGHWLPEQQKRNFKKMAPKGRGRMNKKTEYKKKYKKPGYKNLAFQTTNSRGVNYSNKFAQKPRVHNVDTMYANDYKTHQQRVMKALNQMKR